MSYDVIERSNYDSEPVSLYEFNLGPHRWYYSSGEEDIVLGGRVFKATPITDDGITQSGDAQNDDMKVTLPVSETFPALYIGTPPSEEVWLTVRRKHYGEDDAPVVWVGTISAARQTTATTIEFTAHMMTASFNRNGLRLSWGRNCPHALYDQNCRVDKANYATSLQVEGLSGTRVSSSALAALPIGWLSNGFLEFESMPGITDRRAIELHSGSSFNVLGTTDGLAVGDWITVYPGCNRTTGHCKDKFNNLSNYGGFPHLPSKSPFDGTPVF